MPESKIEFEDVEKIGYLNIAAGIALGLFVFALTISILPRLRGEYLPPWPTALQSYWFYLALSLSIILSHLPIALRQRIILGELKKMNDSLMILTDSLSVNLRTGMNFTSALRRSIQKITSDILKRRMIILLSMVEAGESFERAVQTVSRGLPSYVKEILNVMIPASESGGRAGRVIMIASDFTRRLGAFERSKRNSLSPYFYISLMAIAVFEGATLFLLYLMKNFQQIQQTGMTTGFLLTQMSVTETWGLVFYMDLLIVLLSSIFTSKVVRGKVKFYGDYLIVFTIIHMLIMVLAPLYIIF